MMRILSLPADFFKRYSSGDLASRTGYLQSLCSMLVSAVLNTGLTSVFSLLYISQIFVYAPMLVVPALSITLVTLVFTLVTTFSQMKLTRQQMELASKVSTQRQATCVKTSHAGSSSRHQSISFKISELLSHYFRDLLKIRAAKILIFIRFYYLHSLIASPRLEFFKFILDFQTKRNIFAA